jgi:putative protein kinase ArgK-like GTPase of G3E family
VLSKVKLPFTVWWIFLLLKIAGAGDELQGLGVELWRWRIVINKADGDNIKKANLKQNLIYYICQKVRMDTYDLNLKYYPRRILMYGKQ